MFIASFPAGPWQTNCYVLATEPGAECVVVDPGLDAVRGVEDLVTEHRLKPVAVLLTHGHLDHMFSVTPLCRSSDAACFVHPADRSLLTDPLAAMSSDARLLLDQLAPGTRFTEPDDVRELVDGGSVAVAGLHFGTLHAPGHTPGSVMFQTAYPPQSSPRTGGPREVVPPRQSDIHSLVFTGDVLFAGSVGRTDLPGGNPAHMLDSLRTRVLPLPDSVVVLPGHGPQTTMARERAGNPYLQELV
jgi:glyoxylase-like metal-dependent hydrolase (beta-lactamase superfamily II)